MSCIGCPAKCTSASKLCIVPVGRDCQQIDLCHEGTLLAGRACRYWVFIRSFPDGLLVTERLDWIKSGGALRGKHTEHDADRDRNRNCNGRERERKRRVDAH